MASAIFEKKVGKKCWARHFSANAYNNFLLTGIVNFMKVIASPDWKPEPEAVVVLTQENFTEVVSREELMLVEFYAPW